MANVDDEDEDGGGGGGGGGATLPPLSSEMMVSARALSCSWMTWVITICCNSDHRCDSSLLVGAHFTAAARPLATVAVGFGAENGAFSMPDNGNRAMEAMVNGAGNSNTRVSPNGY